MNTPDFEIVVDESALEQAGFRIIERSELQFEQVTNHAFVGYDED